MSNNVNIDTFEKIDFKTRDISYCIHIYDDNDETTLFVAKEDIDCDDLEVLKNLIKAKHRPEIHGGSCQIVEDILDFAEDNTKGITIANEFYEYSQIEEVFKYDFRRLYKCPICGWESWDDDCAECRQSNCDGEMEFVEEKEYEK